ncbi:MAG: bifunctional DNA-formamidopyrimidine glycosylase/DNA-(apurinic or apyrimidinic site) lyase [Alphaproteobacteria bacterium]
MPELPEVETVKRGLEPVLSGQRIMRCVLNRENLRYPFEKNFAKIVSGALVKALERRGKYIIIHLDGAANLVVHLGMSGQFRIVPAVRSSKNNEPSALSEPQKHDHVIWEIESGAKVIYNDPRRFGFINFLPQTGWEHSSHFARMGPEPLGNHFHADALMAALKIRKAPIKIALLDQSVVAGVGNIYASEALFRAGISPLLPACDINSAAAENLVQAIKSVLSDAIAAGGSTLKDYKHTDGGLGYFQHNFSVYDRSGEPCAGCDCKLDKTGGIQKIVQGGRSTFYCPQKQKITGAGR